MEREYKFFRGDGGESNGEEWTNLRLVGRGHPPSRGNLDKMLFDRNTDFEWTLLNKNLISGSDLANQIVGVIIRFYEEPVVKMGDIEPTFCQGVSYWI